MPKLYEYFGLIVMFYSNEHEPVHVHGKCQGREAKAEFIVIDGDITNILFTGVAGRKNLTDTEMVMFHEIVSQKSGEIVQKWIAYFVLHKRITPERIDRRLK